MNTTMKQLKEKLKNTYFVIGTAYAGKSTLVKGLAERFGGIACEENYHDALEDTLDPVEFPALTYTRDLKDWRHFIRRTPDEYAGWIEDVSKECEIIELKLLDDICNQDKPVFVDTNISIETLKEIASENHVLVMLADQHISVNLFFNRPDREKQFLYRLLMEEPDPDFAMENFRQGLMKINSRENYEKFLNSGFPVILRDENRSIEETQLLAAEIFGLK